MRILQVLLSPRIGGAETLVEGLAHVWDSRSVENEVHFLDPDNFSKRSRVGRLSRLRRAIVRIRPDMVVAHTSIPSIYARLTARKRLPVVIVLHSSANDFDTTRARIAERVLASRTRHVIGVGRRQVDEYIRHFGGRVLTSVIPNETRPGLPRKTKVELKPRVILSVARVAEVKNPSL